MTEVSKLTKDESAIRKTIERIKHLCKEMAGSGFSGEILVRCRLYNLAELMQIPGAFEILLDMIKEGDHDALITMGWMIIMCNHVFATPTEPNEDTTYEQQCLINMVASCNAQKAMHAVAKFQTLDDENIQVQSVFAVLAHAAEFYRPHLAHGTELESQFLILLHMCVDFIQTSECSNFLTPLTPKVRFVLMYLYVTDKLDAVPNVVSEKVEDVLIFAAMLAVLYAIRHLDEDTTRQVLWNNSKFDLLQKEWRELMTKLPKIRQEDYREYLKHVSHIGDYSLCSETNVQWTQYHWQWILHVLKMFEGYVHNPKPLVQIIVNFVCEKTTNPHLALILIIEKLVEDEKYINPNQADYLTNLVNQYVPVSPTTAIPHDAPAQASGQSAITTATTRRPFMP
jgi:hypothetical protein